MADGSQNIPDKMAASRLVCVCVCGCYIGRKPNQPVHLIRSLTAREGEWHKEKDSEREREPSEEQM